MNAKNVKEVISVVFFSLFIVVAIIATAYVSELTVVQFRAVLLLLMMLAVSSIVLTILAVGEKE